MISSTIFKFAFFTINFNLKKKSKIVIPLDQGKKHIINFSVTNSTPLHEQYFIQQIRRLKGGINKGLKICTSNEW